jgi:hypothetical protein
MPAILPGFEPLGGGEPCPRAGSGLGVTLAVLVIVVPSCVTVMTDGTRLGAAVGGGLEAIVDVASVVGADADADDGVLSTEVETT